ncbi:cytochrome P450 [Gigaspora rosea]|uniref:Cytochrome P450 n=1 Tax=Gigaspora rosea TaxID=44941 RepID=A0A397UYS5_9GLOM|nr:cytochrome P450 [Gigaspora rosea]
MIDEIDTIFPPNTPYNWKYVDLIKLEYCDAVINEASRIMSIANDIPRYIPNSTELAGYQWEAGTFHMNISVGHKFSFIPFGGGLRICPGRKLAMIELISLVVEIFGKCDVELIRSNAVTICEELSVRIRPRKYSL